MFNKFRYIQNGNRLKTEPTPEPVRDPDPMDLERWEADGGQNNEMD